MWKSDDQILSEMLGKTFSVKRHSGGSRYDDDSIRFENEEREIILTHRQDCCESCDLVEVVGDLQDLAGSPILEASRTTSNENPPSNEFAEEHNLYIDDSFTWTFYRFRTIKGTVTLRWFGTSNGYYSEECDVVEHVKS